MTQPAGRPPRPHALLAPWLFPVLGACGAGVAPKNPQSTPFVPFGDAATEPDALQFEPALLGLANLDDDDQDGLSDWEDDAVAGEDDTLPLRLEPTLWPADQALTFSLTGDLSQLRVWSDGALLLSADAPTATLPRPAAGFESKIFHDCWRTSAGMPAASGSAKRIREKKPGAFCRTNAPRAMPTASSS